MTAVAQARDAILGTFRTAWLADADTRDYPVKYPDVAQGEFPPKTQLPGGAPTPWARLTMIHSPGAGGQATLSGDTGKRRYERFGVLTIELYSPAGDGMRIADEMIRVAKGAYEGQRVGGVTFHRVRPTEIGPDGPYTHTNVLVEFEYDEVR